MSTELTIVQSRIAKAAATGSMSMAEQVEFFSSIDALLKEHAVRKHPGKSAEKAFTLELEQSEPFRSVVQKSQSLQTELAAS